MHHPERFFSRGAWIAIGIDMDRHMGKGPAARAALIVLMIAMPAGAFFATRGIPVEWQDVGPGVVVRIDVLVVVYTNTAGDRTTQEDIAMLRSEVAEAREFFWRNSRLVVDLAIDFLHVDEFLPLSRFTEASWGGYWLPPGDVTPGDADLASVERDLRARGIRDDQYDGVFVFYAWDRATLPAAYGGTTFGPGYGFLGSTGYSDVPLCWDPTTWSWYFVHEFNHQVDAMLEHAGVPQFQSPDMPWALPGVFGEDYDYNAYLMRLLGSVEWCRLASKGWGHIVRVPDVDRDGVPDHGDFPITEATTGSSPGSIDSDADGLSDLDEILAGIFHSSDPLDPDTDGDGILDGLDAWPRYPVDARASPRAFDPGNGYDLGASGWILNASGIANPGLYRNLSIGSTWTAAGLTMIGRIPDAVNQLTLLLDMQDDGWFHGRDNVALFIQLDPRGMDVRTWASDPEIIAALGVPAWDDDGRYLARFPRVIDPSSTTIVTWDDGAFTGLKVHLPWNMVGTSHFGFLVKIDRVSGQPVEQWVFEQNVLVDVAIAGA